MSKQTILVTGGAGYIGSHVCKALYERGYTPITYDNLCSGNISAVQWGPLEEGDIRNRPQLKAVIEKYKPAAIMHFAALIQVAESVQDPGKYYHNNLYGSLCLLEEARECNIKNLVFSSTAAVYGIPKTCPIPEDAEQSPVNPYGNSKLSMERMVEDFSKGYGLNYAVLRYFNAAGADPECQTGTAYKIDTHLIPLIMQVAQKQLPLIKLFGRDYDTTDGTAVRDYIHVSDLAEAHVLALEYITSGKGNLTLNLGTNKGYSVLEVIDAARKVTGKDIPVHECERRSGDPDQLIADCSRAKEILKWQPKYSDLTTIIETAWEWKQKQVR